METQVVPTHPFEKLILTIAILVALFVATSLVGYFTYTHSDTYCKTHGYTAVCKEKSRQQIHNK